MKVIIYRECGKWGEGNRDRNKGFFFKVYFLYYFELGKYIIYDKMIILKNKKEWEIFLIIFVCRIVLFEYDMLEIKLLGILEL